MKTIQRNLKNSNCQGDCHLLPKQKCAREHSHKINQ